MKQFSFFFLHTFNVNEENYVNKNPDKADRLVLLLADQPFLVIIKK